MESSRQASSVFKLQEAVKALQAHERDQLREAGRRKMGELRSLKAALVEAHAAAKLQQQRQAGANGGTLGTRVSDYSSEAKAHQCPQPQMGQQQLQQPAAPTPAPCGPGSNSLAPARPESSSSSSESCSQPQPNSSSSPVAAAAGAVAAGAAAVAATAAVRADAGPAGTPLVSADHAAAAEAAASAAAARQQDFQQQPPPQQEQQQEAVGQPAAAAAGGGEVGLVPDPMVDILLQQVEALMSEKQQLAAKCCGLERENEQLAELVGHLHDTLETHVDLQEQQQQQQGLPGLSLLQPSAAGPDQDGAPCVAAAGGEEGVGEAMSTSQSPTSTQEGAELPAAEGDGQEGDEAMVVTASLPTLQLTDPQQLPAGGAAANGPPAEGLVLALPMAAAAAAPQVVGPEQVLLAKQKQLRVAEWLDHRSPQGSSSGGSGGSNSSSTARAWQQWQEQLPLEAMSSGSGSSTLTIALADP